MVILGINAFHPDSSACLVVDGKVIVAIEEERILRLKHWAGFPEKAIAACLRIADIQPSAIDKIAINRDSGTHKKEKLLYLIKNRPTLSNVVDRINNRQKVGKVSSLLSNLLEIDENIIKQKLVPVEHHLAHLASTFFTSPYNESVICSIDGFGDFISTMWGLGLGNNIKVDESVSFPHSLGMLYQSITQFLGFWNYGDEYKVMGMAAYGKPTYTSEIMKLIKLYDGGKFELVPEYFNHPVEGVSMEFNGGCPVIGAVFSEKMSDLLGPSRGKDEKISQKHKDIACSVQKVYEDALFNILSHLNKLYPTQINLCLAGGCAQNSLANGKITTNTNFEKVWIQPAAGDSGGALGAALTIANMHSNEKRNVMVSPALGISYSNKEIYDILEKTELSLFNRLFIDDEDQLTDYIAQLLVQGKVIGFFHGAFEWGPRALGNRSIIVDPRLDNMKDLLNRKIKKRESFRPFAPSVLKDKVHDWFEKDEDVSFMTHVFNIKESKRKLIPAVTHQDGTGRLQSVTEEFNSRYYNIIKKFDAITQVPMILNTSFNENEPIVNTPEEALACFLRTDMDVVVLENHIIER
jgi:carbamoyltransferase